MPSFRRFTAKTKTFFRKVTGTTKTPSSQANSDLMGYQEGPSGQALHPVSKASSVEPSPPILGMDASATSQPRVSDGDDRVTQDRTETRSYVCSPPPVSHSPQDSVIHKDFEGVPTSNRDLQPRPSPLSSSGWSGAAPSHAVHAPAPELPFIQVPQEFHGQPLPYSPPVSPLAHPVQNQPQVPSFTPPTAPFGARSSSHERHTPYPYPSSSPPPTSPLRAAQVQSPAPSPAPPQALGAAPHYFPNASGFSIGQVNTSNVQNFVSSKSVFDRKSLVPGLRPPTDLRKCSPRSLYLAWRSSQLERTIRRSRLRS